MTTLSIYKTQSIAKLLVILTVFAGHVSIAAERGGGTHGGGGNQYEENFFAVAGEAIDNLKLFPGFESVVKQAETLFENEPKIKFVDQLTDCNGEAIVNSGQYAYSCRGEIQLDQESWTMWLKTKISAQAQVKRIFHEVLRVTAYSEKMVTNDQGFKTTNEIFKITDLLTNKNCEQSYKRLMRTDLVEALNAGFILTDIDKSTIANTNGFAWHSVALPGCVDAIAPMRKLKHSPLELDFSNDDSLSPWELQTVDCKTLAKKYSFAVRIEDKTPVTENDKTYVKVVLTRKCIASDNSILDGH